MLLAISLALALAADGQAQTTRSGESHQRAEALAASGDYRGALERFQAIAAANPDDVEARLWIARLYGLLGDHGRSRAVYESIVATDANHVDALVGLGQALLAEGRLDDASAALNRAESLAGERSAALAAQGRLHALAGRSALAMAYYERALALDPGAAAVRDEYDRLRARRAHRLELGYVFENFNLDVPDTHAGLSSFDARLTDEWRLSAAVQHHRTRSRGETRGGAGLEWAPRHDLRVRGGALFGGDTDVLPATDAYAGLEHTRGRATWSFDLRFADFNGVGVDVAGGGLQLALPRGSTAWVKYYRFATDYEVATSDIVHSWVLGASARTTRRSVVGGEYTRGPDQLHLLTIDRLARFETNTYSGFVEYFATPMLSLHARYDVQDRPQRARVQRAVARLIQRF